MTLPNNMARYINVKLLYTQASFKSCFWSFISTENATNDVFPRDKFRAFLARADRITSDAPTPISWLDPLSSTL